MCDISEGVFEVSLVVQLGLMVRVSAGNRGIRFSLSRFVFKKH